MLKKVEEEREKELRWNWRVKVEPLAFFILDRYSSLIGARDSERCCQVNSLLFLILCRSSSHHDLIAVPCLPWPCSRHM